MSNFEIVNTGEDVDFHGTSLVGYVRADYDELVACFKHDLGPSSDDKVRFQFCVEFFDKESDRYVVATIYDWKSDVPRDDVAIWNVGGKDVRSIQLVQDALHAYRFPQSK